MVLVCPLVRERWGSGSSLSLSVCIGMHAKASFSHALIPFQFVHFATHSFIAAIEQVIHQWGLAGGEDQHQVCNYLVAPPPSE